MAFASAPDLGGRVEALLKNDEDCRAAWLNNSLRLPNGRQAYVRPACEGLVVGAPNRAPPKFLACTIPTAALESV